ncbi:hypothetical protein [Maribacter confluentis]|uniref:hypothetical protein n=1 Tax=Maribacter confluentis TaxID=1656093 RepID=UPI00345C4941
MGLSEIIRQEPMTITSGRFINQNDIEDKRKIAVIGDGVQNELYDKGEQVLEPILKFRGQLYGRRYLSKKERGGGEEGQKKFLYRLRLFPKPLIWGIMWVGWP